MDALAAGPKEGNQTYVFIMYASLYYIFRIFVIMNGKSYYTVNRYAPY